MSGPKQLPHDSGAEDSGTRTIDLLRKIQAESVDPKAISKIDRQQLVVVLMADGMSNAEMAQLLGVADRTIERDKKSIRTGNAIAKDPGLLEQMVGRLMAEAEVSIQHIRKAIRGKGVSASVRVEGAQRCIQILFDLVKSFQSLGYLPTATQKVEAELTHHLGEVPSYSELREQLGQIQMVAKKEGDLDGTVSKNILVIEGQLNQADLATKIEGLASSITEDPIDETE